MTWRCLFFSSIVWCSVDCKTFFYCFIHMEGHQNEKFSQDEKVKWSEVLKRKTQKLRGRRNTVKRLQGHKNRKKGKDVKSKLLNLFKHCKTRNT